MHPRLAELTEHLAAQRRLVLVAASVVPSESWQTHPADGRWSVSEIFQHLHLVESGVTSVLSKRIGMARETGHRAETETSSVLGTLEPFGVSDRSRTLEAPERVVPTENPDRETAERRLAASRASLLAALASGDGLALGEIRHTHLRFGELDLYQWCLFVAEHERRHASQIRELATQLAPAS